MHIVTTDDEFVSLPRRWADFWGEHPEQMVLRCDDRWLSAGEIDGSTRALAGALLARGVKPFDRVVVEAKNSADFVLVALAVLRLGAVLVPVNAGQSDLERTTSISEVSPALIVAPHRALLGQNVLQCQARDLSLRSPEAPFVDGAGRDDVALIIFTSGTTGTPKGAVISHGNLAAQADALIQAWGWTSDDRLVSALPLFHVHGLVAALLTSLSVGASIDVRPKFDADDYLEAMRVQSASMSFCVPTMLHRMASSPHIESVRALRLLVSGSAPLSQELFGRFGEIGAVILERYGMTESLLTLSNPLHGERRAGTVGFALPNVLTQLPEPGGGEQELRVKGPGIFVGYWNRPEATDEILEDGWLHTGDIVRVDSDGYIAICGRSKELIITGGFNVYPSEVEDVILTHPTIHDAAVIGIESSEWGEEVVAFVVIDSGSFDDQALADYLQGTMSSYKVPRRFVVVDELPRNALGKLQRHLLR